MISTRSHLKTLGAGGIRQTARVTRQFYVNANLEVKIPPTFPAKSWHQTNTQHFPFSLKTLNDDL